MNAPRPGAAVALVLAAATTALLAGCGLIPGKTASDVTLTVTENFGTRVLQRSAEPKLTGSVSVLQLLRRDDRVATRHGGAFVQSIDGVAGDDAGDQPVDWFFYVNGVQTSTGAAATAVHGGDAIWWDRHDWGASDEVPDVVGSYPEPFVHGTGGKRLPITIYCEPPSSSACHTVATRLLSVGVIPAFGALGTDEPQTLRVLVGPWSQLSVDAAAASLANGPSASGVYARFNHAGTRLTLLAPDGRAVRTLGAGAGLVAATSLPTESPTWIVTGTDSAGVDRAAALDARALHDHFAVALAPTGSMPVPVVASR